MGEVVPFNFDGAPIRVMEIGGDPWFVGKDVALALGYGNPQDAIRRHCKKTQDVGGAGNAHPSDLDPQTKIIPEGDVYRLIVRSNLPSAERFESMVMDEILPTIRKTGSYGVSRAATINLDDPAQLVPLLTSYAKRTQIAEDKVSRMQPKAEALEHMEASEGSVSPRIAAKTLNVPERKFFRWLHANNWSFRQGKTWQGYSERIKQGYIEHEPYTYTVPETGEERTRVQMKITPKGMARLARIFCKGDQAA